MRADLDAAMAGVRLGGERKAAILAALEEGAQVTKKQGTFRAVLIAAALCAALAATALALSPTLRDALGGLLGDFAPYARAVEGVSATDQGIELRVVRTLADENGGTVYLEARDRTGDRLTGRSALQFPSRTCAAYDEKSRTALFEIPIDPMWYRGRDADGCYTLAFDTLLPAVATVDGVSLPWALLSADKLETLELKAEECEQSAPRLEPEKSSVVLAPNQTGAELETGLVSLSSMGFDEDGVFHLQLRLADGVYPSTEYAGLYTTCPETDWEAEPGVLQELHTTFVWDGARYYDICWEELTAERFGAFRIAALEGEVVVGTPIAGNWTLRFPLELLPERTITLSEPINGQVVEQITITATSLKEFARYEDPEHTTVLGYPLTVYLEDGGSMVIPYSDADLMGSRVDGAGNRYYGFTGERYGADIVWHFPHGVDPETVTGIAIGLRYLPLNVDGTAGPGRWLTQE